MNNICDEKLIIEEKNFIDNNNNNKNEKNFIKEAPKCIKQKEKLINYKKKKKVNFIINLKEKIFLICLKILI